MLCTPWGDCNRENGSVAQSYRQGGDVRWQGVSQALVSHAHNAVKKACGVLMRARALAMPHAPPVYLFTTTLWSNKGTRGAHVALQFLPPQ